MQPSTRDVASPRYTWRDVVGFGTCAAAGLALLWWIAREPGSTLTSGDSAQPPSAGFTDVTATSGIHFIHDNGAAGEKLLPETMGGGVAFFDFDNDGAPDLLFVNSGPWPWAAPTNGAPRRPNSLALYRNDGSGHFSDVTSASGLDSTQFYGMGVACADFDNDGWVDCLITAVGDQRLFKNLGGGKFADVTRAAGLELAAAQWGTSAAWLDFDNDGRLDLFVGHYVDWTRERDLRENFTYDGRTRAYGPPRLFDGTFPTLYHNEGGGRFRDVSRAAGLLATNSIGRPLAKTLGVAPVDLDADGWIDLILANDTVQNLVFRNEHDGTFREIGARSGIAFDAFGSARGAMGIDTARFRGDDTLAVAIGNFANEMNSFYVTQNDPLHFADEAIRAGFGPASQDLLKFGLFFFDYDLDGRLDVLTANGHLDPDIERFAPKQRYRQPAQLFWNHPGGRASLFVPVSAQHAGADLFQPIAGRGSAFADIDGDGDLDIVLTQVGGPPRLLRNEQRLGHHWTRIRLRGQSANRDGIGAWLHVRAGGQTLARQVMPTKGYLSQSELTLTFGLGSAQKIDEAEVVWPGGARQKITGLRLEAVNLIPQAE